MGQKGVARIAIKHAHLWAVRGNTSGRRRKDKKTKQQQKKEEREIPQEKGCKRKRGDLSGFPTCEKMGEKHERKNARRRKVKAVAGHKGLRP